MEAHITFSGRFNYKAGTGCTLHAHDKDFQVQLIYGGSAKMRMNDKTFHIEENDVVFLKKGCMHSFIAETTLKTVELKFDTDNIESLNLVKTVFKDKNGQLFNILSNIVIEGQRRNFMYKEVCNALLQQALIYMIRTCQDQTAGVFINEEKPSDSILGGTTAMEAIDDWIYQNLDKNFTLKELSLGCGYNQDYLYRVIRKTKDMTLIQYVNKLKFEEAKRLISHSDLSISEISWNLGFESLAYFSRFFKKFANMSPTEYSTKVRNAIRTDY